MVAKRLGKNDACKYALTCITAKQRGVRWNACHVVGEYDDDVYVKQFKERKEAIVYIDGTNSIEEWTGNILAPTGDFGGAEDEICEILKSLHASGFDTIILVGYSRGASIAVKVGDISDYETYVVTIGDPGLCVSTEENITCLYNQYDIVFGLWMPPSGKHEQVSSLKYRWNGWGVTCEDIGTHMNYGETLQNEADKSVIKME